MNEKFLILIYCILGLTIQDLAQTPRLTIFNQEDSVKMLALGDSYTIGESVAENERWPVQLVNQFGAYGYKTQPPVIIARTGWRTDQLADAIKNADLKNNFNLVSLLIGVNNQYQGRSVAAYGPEFKSLLETAVKLAGGKKDCVIVLSIPDYGFTPFGSSKKDKISAEINQFNRANQNIAEALGITYINITDISRQGLVRPELVANDGLHPSALMYRLWNEKIISVLSLK